MHFGAAWYPEHWPEARWEEDVRLMRDAGMNVCRIGEFAWSTLEPTEGYYDFGWLERAVTLADKYGLAVVIGTPTAAPPAWLTHHHPDTLATEPSGKLAQHGNRCHYNPSSVTYLKYVRRIVEQMARRFGSDPRVIGWQIDNEYSRVDYSEDTCRRFQAYLKEQYVTLEALNRHWSTAYWSQTYSDWREIPIPIGPHNPGLMLAFRRFVSRVWRDFQKLQIDVIRQFAPTGQWITHNFMGWFDGFDHYTVAKDLSMVSWDWYVGTGHHDYLNTGVVHDLTRGLLQKNFWLMETQPGCVNWSENNNALNKGEARCMAWHAVAHGADALLYWQWRSAPGGQEQLHGSLLGADGLPRPFYSEAQQIGADFKQLSEVLEGTQPANEVAILHSYDSRWSVNAQRHNKAFDPVEVLRKFTRPLALRNIGTDVIEPESCLDSYKMVMAPALVVLTDAAVKNLEAFVKRGGLLIIGVRTGQKDSYNALFESLQPGPLRELAGVEVEEYYALDQPAPVKGHWNGEHSCFGESQEWAELLRPLSADLEIVARYGESNGWLDGGAAITITAPNASGGRVAYVGALLDPVSQDSLTDWLVGLTNISPVWPSRVPGVEFYRRTAEDQRSVLFAINHTRLACSIPVIDSGTFTDLLTGEVIRSEFSLPPYGVCVLTR